MKVVDVQCANGVLVCVAPPARLSSGPPSGKIPGPPVGKGGDAEGTPGPDILPKPSAIGGTKCVSVTAATHLLQVGASLGPCP